MTRRPPGSTPFPYTTPFRSDGATPQPIADNQTITLTGVATGSHTVVLSGIAANCTVSGGTSRTVTVTASQTVTASYTVSSPPPPPPTRSLAAPTSTSDAAAAPRLFFNDTPTPGIHPLSLHDALPIGRRHAAADRRQPDHHADRGGHRESHRRLVGDRGELHRERRDVAHRHRDREPDGHRELHRQLSPAPPAHPQLGGPDQHLRRRRRPPSVF